MPKIITKKSSYGSFSWDHVLCRHCIYGTSFAPNGRPHKVTQHRYPSWSFFGSHFRGLQKLAWQSFCAYFGWLLLPEMWSNFYKHFSSDVIVYYICDDFKVLSLPSFLGKMRLPFRLFGLFFAGNRAKWRAQGSNLKYLHN